MWRCGDLLEEYIGILFYFVQKNIASLFILWCICLTRFFDTMDTLFIDGAVYNFSLYCAMLLSFPFIFSPLLQLLAHTMGPIDGEICHL